MGEQARGRLAGLSTSPTPAAGPAAWGRILLGAASVAVVIGMTMGIVHLMQRPVRVDGGAAPLRRPSEVEYRLVGHALQASITLETPQGAWQKPRVGLPLRDPVTGQQGLRYWFDRGDLVYLSAQNDGGQGDLTCQILVDGRLVAQDTTADPYGIAACTTWA